MALLWNIYQEDIPDFLQEISETPEMRRLRNVGMNCGMEYTNYPIFRDILPYSRFEHSMGVALIVWHFTHSIEQSIAGLLHDVATPTFAHVVDFLNQDHLHQDSTEAGTAEMIASSDAIQHILHKLRIPSEAVQDYHRYPVADNDSPQLSADRLEYTLGNAYRYGFLTVARIREMYSDLAVDKNEFGVDELCFRSASAAEAFSEASLKCSKVYVSDADRYGMQILADILAEALDRRIICRAELYRDEPYIIRKMENSSIRDRWQMFRALSNISRSEHRPDDGNRWITIVSKKRHIDPLVIHSKRASELFISYQTRLTDFLEESQDYWVHGR